MRQSEIQLLLLSSRQPCSCNADTTQRLKTKLGVRRVPPYNLLSDPHYARISDRVKSLAVLATSSSKLDEASSSNAATKRL